MVDPPVMGRTSSLPRLHDNTQTHHTPSGRVISLMQKLLNTTLTTNIHAPAGFEPTVPTTERPHTHVLDRTAPGIGRNFCIKL